MHIELDIRTLIFILGTTHLMQVLVFYQQFRVNKTYKGVGWWLAWSAAEVVGFSSMFFRSQPSLFPLVVIIQNSMIVGGTLFLYFGVRRFFDLKLNLKLLIPLVSFFVSGLLFYLFIIDNIQVRSAFISATLSILSILTAHSLITHKTKQVSASANFLASIFLIHGIVFIYRFGMIITGTPVENIFTPTLFNFLPYFDALIVSLVWTFGFIIMLNQRMKAEMSEAKEDLQLIFNTSPDAAIITRLKDDIIVDVNKRFSTLSGYSHAEILGKSTLDLNFWKNAEDCQVVIKQLKEQGFCNNFETVYVRKDKKEMTAILSAEVIRFQDIPHVISILHDITERKKAEQEIRLKNEELLILNAERDKLYSIIAHDLRSPFNGFLGLTQIMAEDLPKMAMPEIQQLALMMRKSANNLYRLLENLLQWAKMQQGLISFNQEILELRPIIDESIAMVIELAINKGVQIYYDIPENLTIFADNNILQTVIRNLISNAVKFTPKGGKIWISGKVSEDDFIEVSVKDDGIGMSSEIIENLFHFDVQTNRKGTEGEPSTGLGLLLCKELIEKHGGKIWAESKKGEQGSIFYFTLPNSDVPEKK